MSLYSLSLLFVCFGLVWIILAQNNFLYGLWHDHVGIAEAIERFAPDNRYKPGFADTTRQQRLDAFAAINRAIHRNGQGLETIRYQSPSSHGEQTLLRAPEIVHLQDVASLLVVLTYFFCLCIALLIATACINHYCYRRAPSAREQIGLSLVLLVVCVAVVFSFGPEKVFYTLHIWVFPGDHQWFFYYQDSLMSTMMMAPMLFAWIAVIWTILSMLLYLLLAVWSSRILLAIVK